MLWLIVTITAYLILAIVFVVNKYLLAGPLPNPKAFAFYVGALGILILFIIPFTGFFTPSLFQVFLSLAAGALFVYALFFNKLPERIKNILQWILPTSINIDFTK